MNVDQRIAEDIKTFVERTLYVGLRLLNATVSFFSFVVILWTLSAEAPFRLFGYDMAIPGYLVWAALVYAVAGTVLTHLIGRPLIGLNFQQQRYEADFRFNLVRARESAKEDQRRARQHVRHFLLRHGRRPDGATRAWTAKYETWLRSVRFEQPALEATMLDVMFEIPSMNRPKEVVISEETVARGERPLVVLEKDKAEPA